MFKIKFVDDVMGCDPEEVSTCDMSNKQFLCRVVEEDPLENIENDIKNDINHNAKKLIITSINTIGTKLKKQHTIINNVPFTQWNKQNRHRKRFNRNSNEIYV